MYVALFDSEFCGKYRGIYRKPPLPPSQRQLYLQWTDYMELTEGGFPIEYSYNNYSKLLSLYIQLSKENGAVDFIFIDKTADLDIKTTLLGYDVTNDTTFYSILGEIGIERKSFINKGLLNDNVLFKSRADASLLAKYMNDNAVLFEGDGLYRSVSISKVIVEE